MALGGLFAGMQSSNLLQIDLEYISRSSQEIFLQLFECEPVAISENNEEAPIFKIVKIRSDVPFHAQQRYLTKIGTLYYHAASHTGTDLCFMDSGPDHLERLLTCFDSSVELQKAGQAPVSELEKRMARKFRQSEKPETKILLPDPFELKGRTLEFPNDVSLASIYALAATLIPDSEIIMENVLLNPSRNGFFNALRRMGAQIEILQKKELFCETSGKIKVAHAELKGRKFDSESLKGMMDEIPLLFIAGAYASGETIIRDIAFMREYNQDLLKKVINALKEAKVEIGEIEDGLVIRGQSDYDGHDFSTFNNALIGFAFYVFSIKSYGVSTISDIECMTRLFPDTIENLQKLAGP
jgi:5-enolpyruvylshikimate-3-phosphate synthase